MTKSAIIVPDYGEFRQKTHKIDRFGLFWYDGVQSFTRTITSFSHCWFTTAVTSECSELDDAVDSVQRMTRRELIAPRSSPMRRLFETTACCMVLF
jgi:hypothetical protein